MKRLFFLVILVTTIVIDSFTQDTLKSVVLSNIEIVSSPKETGSMKQQPASVTLIGQKEMEQYHITSLKGVSTIAPNLFIPDYGSRLTSAMYIRGVGARINTPSVGLYVDNIPYVEKSAFDFNFYDIERIDILRGPQGTLYGRNTMGGLIKIYTKNPFVYQGTDVRLGYSTQDNHRRASLTHYHRINNKFAFAGGGYYEGSNGFFKHSLTGHEIDDMQAGGGRIRAIFLPTDKLKYDFTLSYDYNDEGAYPYYYTGVVSDSEEKYPDLIGKISNNREKRYRRGLLNAGLNVEYITKQLMFNSVTGYQNLNDRMYLDQDFIQPDIYSLEQKQKSNVISQEFTLKNKPTKSSASVKWNWLFGASMFYQWMDIKGPVNFYSDGIKTLIEDNVNSIFINLQKTIPTMPSMAMDVTDESFEVSSNMKAPVFSGALFHQSIISIGDLDITAGIRAEYEKMKLDYHSDCLVNYNFSISMPPRFNKVYEDLRANPLMEGNMDKDYLQILPKLTLKYSFGKKSVNGIKENFVYTTISKGYRSGGYNTQMFSDLVQGQMKNMMIDTINGVSGGMMGRFVDIESLKTKIDISSVSYKPEYSWNYELGSKFQIKDFKFQIAGFYSTIYDQQIARFAESGMGRMMVNAGKSRSFGGEFSTDGTINLSKNLLTLHGSYGYTNSKFQDYDDGENKYDGNYVPFVPMHTVSLAADWKFPVKESYLTIGADWSGNGKIYWTENNSASQNFYDLLGAHIGLDYKFVSVNIWGKNLTDKKYDSFYFESVSRGYCQHGKPVQFGMDVKLHF